MVHISDLHIDDFGFREKRLISVLSELSPDLIFITGDICTWEGKNFSGFLKFISRVNARFGTFLIFGDADYNYPHQSKMCILCHYKSSPKLKKWKNFMVLRNKTVKINIHQKELLVCGLDTETPYNPNIKKSEFISKNPNTPMILLDHAFRGFGFYKQKPELILSGNTHGGQVQLPLLEDYLTKKAGHYTKYLSGLFKKKERFLYVNRGIGTSKLPIRFLCPPEVTVFRFINPSYSP